MSGNSVEEVEDVEELDNEEDEVAARYKNAIYIANMKTYSVVLEAIATKLEYDPREFDYPYILAELDRVMKKVKRLL